MAGTSFNALTTYNNLLIQGIDKLQPARDAAVDKENPLYYLFQRTQASLRNAIHLLPKEVSDETQADTSMRIYREIENLTYFVDSEMPGFTVLRSMIEGWLPPPVRAVDNVPTFTDKQKDLLQLLNIRIMLAFQEMDPNARAARKIIQAPRHGLPIPVRVQTLVGKLTPYPPGEDRTCAKILRAYKLIQEQQSIAYPLEGGYTRDFEGLVKVLPTNKEELNAFENELHRNGTIKGLGKQICDSYQKCLYDGVRPLKFDKLDSLSFATDNLLTMTPTNREGHYGLYKELKTWVVTARKIFNEKVAHISTATTERKSASPSDPLEELEKLIATLPSNDTELDKLCEL